MTHARLAWRGSCSELLGITLAVARALRARIAHLSALRQNSKRHFMSRLRRFAAPSIFSLLAVLGVLFAFQVEAQTPAGGAVPLAPEKTHILIAVGGKAGFYYLPLTIAEQLGYFKAEGLDVEISDFAGGAKALEALVGGSVDVVSGAYEHTIDMQSRGQHLRAFALMGRAPQISIGVASAKAAAVNSAAELKGMKVGVSAPGSSTNMALNFFLAQAGLKPSDVSVIAVGTSAGAIAALKSGEIDAISNVDPVMTMLEQRHDVKIIADARTMKGTEQLFGGPMPAATLYAPEDFIKKYPGTTQALANAIVHADRWLAQAGPSDIVKAVPESYLLGDRALYLASFAKVRDAFSPDGLIPEQGTRTALKVLASFNPRIDPAKIDLSTTYTNDFARRADAKFP
jgi:NitT/TauT family transport system substrate-binding protein